MKRRLLLAVVVLAVALLGIALACGSNPVYVATIVDAAAIDCEISDAGDAGNACPSGSFCSRTLCSPSKGHCEAIEADGCTTSEPECGCDGVTYFDRCLRQKARVSRATVGSCSDQIVVRAKPCPCEQGQHCATVFSQPFFNLPDAASFGLPDGATLGPDVTDRCNRAASLFPGFCWVLPDKCPPMPGPGAGTVAGCDLKCIDECSAIRDGGVYAVCSAPSASAAP